MWKTVQLGDLCEILDTRRKPITKKDRIHGEYPYYGATGIVDWVADYIFDEELVLIGEDGAKWDAGEKTAFIVDGKYWVNNHAHVVKPNTEKLLNKWLTYYLCGIDLKPWVTGMTVPKLNQGQLKSIPIPLPPLAEQERIVAKLDAAFAEIDEAVENLKNKKMNLKKLMDSVLERFFNNESFDEYELKDVCTFVGGSQPPKSEFEYEESENNIRLIQIRDYKSDRHIVYIPKDKARRFCTKDDVMIGRYGPPIFQILRGIEGSYNVALMKAIPKENILNDYLFYFLKNRRIQNFVINKSSRAAGQSGVNKDALEPYIINLPSLDIQKNICKASKELELQDTYLSNLYKKKLDNLMSLKSAILSQELQSSEAA